MLYVCLIYVFLFSAVLSLVSTRIIIRVARILDVVDAPGGRKIHREPVPLLGGLAIYVSFLFTVLLHVWLARFAAYSPWFFEFLPVEVRGYLGGVGEVWEKLRAILLGGTVMALLGLLDDIREVGARKKLLVQALAALIPLIFGIRITLFVDNAAFGWVVTVIWIVAITNAFNLLDNMDGLSAGIAFIAALIFFWTAWSHGYFFISAILLVYAGSLLGFLRYNFNPARVFMGDAGSLFIGYMLASLTVLNRYYAGDSPTLFPVLMPVLILAVPIYDTLSVIAIRIKNRESIFKPDRRHFSHRLVNLGFSRRQAVLLVYLVSLCVGASSLLLRQVDAFGAAVIMIQATAVFGIIVSLEAAGSKEKRADIKE